MNDTTLTLRNLKEIYTAMSKIKNIDRSDYFNNYFTEIKKQIEIIKIEYEIFENYELKNEIVEQFELSSLDDLIQFEKGNPKINS